MRWEVSTLSRWASRASNRAVALTVVIALGLVACTGDDPATKVAPTPTSPRPGGHVVIGVLGEPATLDPYHRAASDLTRALVRPLYPSLFRLNPDGSTERYLASSIDVLAGGGVQIEIADASWSDGRPITPADVRASIRRARPPSGFADISSARVVGERTLELSGPVVDWQATLARAAYVLPRGRPDRAYGGPYGLATTTPGRRFVFRRNDGALGGEPQLDRITIEFVASTNTLYELLREGKLDAAITPTSVNVDDRLEEIGVAHASELGWESIRLDLRRSGLPRAQRLAVWASIDRAGLADRFLDNLGRTSDTITPGPGIDGADGPWSDATPPGLDPTTSLRIVAPVGDELLQLLQRALFESLSSTGLDVEVARVQESLISAGRYEGIALVRASGAPGASESRKNLRQANLAPLFHVSTTLSWQTQVQGPQVNPTIDGPLWNVERWIISD